MDSWESSKLAEAIERKLREIIIRCIEEHDGECDFERKVHQAVNERMYGFVRSSSSFDLNILRDYELKNSSCDVSSGNDCVRGKIELEYHEKCDRYKYGEPGYRGNKDGEICQYPDYADRYYQWENFREKWIDVTDKVCGNNRRNSNGFMNNAAFEPLWGNNRSGGDTFSTNRHRNGGDLWGNPQIRKPLGGFKKISANVFKSIYNFTLNLKSAISHYLKIEEALKSDDPEIVQKVMDTISNSSFDLPKVKITVEKVNHWSYFYNNGHIDQSGGLTRKDTLVYVKDSLSAQDKVKRKNEEIKRRELEKFKNR